MKLLESKDLEQRYYIFVPKSHKFAFDSTRLEGDGFPDVARRRSDRHTPATSLPDAVFVREVSFMRRTLLLLATAVTLGTTTPWASAQRGPRGGEDWYPLGGLEAMGDIVDGPGKGSGIEVKRVHDGGPAAKGELQVGDVITHAGKTLKGKPAEVIAQFAAAVEKAEAKGSGKFGKLVLKVVTADGKKKKRTIPVRRLGSHAKSCPHKCNKCDVILADALDYLKDAMGGDGIFQVGPASNNQHVVTSSLAGLAWHGAGKKKKYAKPLQTVASFVAKSAGQSDGFPARRGGANWNQTNWPLSYGSVFLAELIGSDRHKKHRKDLKRMVAALAKNQEESGGWAHGPGGPNALDYLELEIMSNYALAGLGMARRAGIQIDEGKAGKGLEYVKSCTSGGGVAYSTRPGQAGHGDPGRTAGAWWAFRQLGRKGKVAGQMKGFFQRRLDELPEGHVSPAMHILAGGVASAMAGKANYAKFWKIYRPYIMAARSWDGAFDARPTAESRQLRSNSDRGCGKPFVTAHFAICMQLAQGRYKLLDRLGNGKP